MFAFLVWRANPRSQINLRFSLAAVCVSGWTLGVAGRQNASDIDPWLRLAFASASLIPATFLAFAHCYPTRTERPSHRVVALALGLGIILAVLSVTSNLIFYDAAATPMGLHRKSGPLYPAFAVYFVATWCLAFGLLADKWRRARGLARDQLRYLVIGIAITGCGAITTNLLLPLLTRRSSFTWAGPYFGVALIALLAHAIVRHRAMDIRLVIHRGLTLFLAAIMSLLPVAVVVVAVWPRLSAHLQAGELFAFLIAALVVGLLIPITRDSAEHLLDRYVYRTHADYQTIVREASKALTKVLNLKHLLGFLATRLREAVQAEGAAIYLLEGCAYRLILEARGPATGFEAPDTAPASIVVGLSQTRDRLALDELHIQGTPSPDRAAAAADLERLNWALVLPLVSDDTVIGVIAIGPKLSGDPFYPQDLDLLTTLANQAGIAIKNAQLYAEVVLANEYIENIVATINSGVVAINAEGRITMFNRAAEQLTGLARSAVHLQPVAGLPACLSAALGQTVIDGRQLTQPEIALPDGTNTRPVMCTTSALRDAAGNILGAVAVFSDLTPLKELESERRRVEKASYLEVVASGLAHEIKNPLVSIKAFAQLLPRRHDDPQFRDNFVRIVPREVARVEGLLERLGTLARPSDRPQHPFDVRAPIREALEFVQPDFDEKRVSLTSRLPQGETLVLGNHDEVKQLVYNLLMNAHEATPPGGAVTLELAARGEHATALIADTGPGIPAELLDRIFDAFITTRKRGSGLGLAICARIADAHRARLRAANGAGGGAVFTVEFPLLTGVPAPVSA